MKAVIDRKNLAEALRKLDRVVSKNTNTPSLNAVLVKAANGGLELSATDLDLFLTLRVDAEVQGPGEVLVSREIIRQVNALNAPEISLQEDGTRLNAAWPTGNASIACMDVDSFPQRPEARGDEGTIKAVDLREIAELGFCSDENNPLWCAIATDGEYAVATDSHRIAAVKTGIKLPLLKARDYSTLADIVEGEAEYKASEHGAEFKWNSGSCYIRAVAGKFPDWRQALPKGDALTVKCSWLELVDALKVVTPLAGKLKGFSMVNLAIRPERIFVSASSDAGQAQEEIACEASGEINVTCNARYLVQALRYVEPGEIKFYGETKPVVMENGDRMALVMPIRRG